MRVWKMNGCGNAFAIIDGRATALHPTPDKIRQIAKVFRADQVIVIERALPPKHAFMRIWNADGGEVSACGNATRCVGQLLMDEEKIEKAVIQTRADVLKAFRAEEGLITVDMGSPLQQWTDIPLAEDMDVNGIDLKIGPMDKPYLARPAVVSMGNPHAMFFVDNVDDYDIPKIGPLVEGHPVFPEGANVGFAEVRGISTIRLRVWERGAGLTLACGTGACAAVVCAARKGLTGRKVKTILDGGELTIDWDEKTDHVFMTGPVELEFEKELVV